MRSMVEGGSCQVLSPLHRAARGPPPRPGEDHYKSTHSPPLALLSNAAWMKRMPAIPSDRLA